MNQKFIAKSNYLLRKVLNSEESLDILQDFIESILNINVEKIILNPFLNKKENQLQTEENFGIADVRIKTKDKQELNVGVQFIDGKYIQTKMLLYYALVNNNQIEYQDKRKIVDTVTINILNQNFYDSFSYHKIVKFSNSNKQESSNKQEKDKDEDKDEDKVLLLHVIELPKFQPMFLQNLDKEEQWITYLKGDNAEEVERVKKMNQKIKKLDILIDNFWNEERIE